MMYYKTYNKSVTGSDGRPWSSSESRTQNAGLFIMDSGFIDRAEKHNYIQIPALWPRGDSP